VRCALSPLLPSQLRRAVSAPTRSDQRKRLCFIAVMGDTDARVDTSRPRLLLHGDEPDMMSPCEDAMWLWCRCHRHCFPSWGRRGSCGRTPQGCRHLLCGRAGVLRAAGDHGGQQRLGLRGVAQRALAGRSGKLARRRTAVLPACGWRDRERALQLGSVQPGQHWWTSRRRCGLLEGARVLSAWTFLGCVGSLNVARAS
jgi:hypothetical protein